MIVKVNGEAVEEGEVQQEMERMRPQYEPAFPDMDPEEKEAQLAQWARENVVERVLIRQAALREFPQIPGEEVEAFYQQVVQEAGGEESFLKRNGLEVLDIPKVKASMTLQLQVQRLMEKITEKVERPGEEEIRAFYEENPEYFMQPEMVRASHIIKHHGPEENRENLRDELEKVHKQLRNNGFFSDLVKEHSDCPDNEGDLGFFPRGQMVQEFEDVVFNMKVGETSSVFETPFGFHIAKVTDHKAEEKVALEGLEDRVEAMVWEDRRRQAVEVYLDGEKEKAQFEET